MGRETHERESVCWLGFRRLSLPLGNGRQWPVVERKHGHAPGVPSFFRSCLEASSGTPFQVSCRKACLNASEPNSSSCSVGFRMRTRVWISNLRQDHTLIVEADEHASRMHERLPEFHPPELLRSTPNRRAAFCGLTTVHSQW